MKQHMVGVLLAQLVLCLALVGCGATGGSEAISSAESKLVGVWEIDSMVKDGEEVSSDDTDLMRSFGLNVYLSIEADGIARLNLYGENISGTWNASSDTVGTVTFAADGGGSGLAPNTTITLADDKLTVGSASMADTTMIFERTTKEEMDAFLRETQTEVPRDERDKSSETTALDVAVADDDKLSLALTGMRDDYDGDPSVNFTMTNKTDQAVYLTSASDAWTVDGVAVTPVVSTHLEAGGQVNDYLFFHRDELGGGVERLVNVRGTLELQDVQGNVIASYEVSF